MAKPNKLYPSESLRRRPPLLIGLLVLLALGGVMQKIIDPIRLQFQPKDNLNLAAGGLNNEFLLLPLLGFREAAAGLLWVRADEFFHSGDYDAILPLVRLITWLDPHADNVYTTGAWHLAYNFTDSTERSDRRYIAPAQALLDEGIANNKNIADIKFEKGWQCYDKIKDFNAAEAAYHLAIDGPDVKTTPGLVKDKNLDTYPYACPQKVLHMLAHTYEKQGRIPEALDAWQFALDRSAEILTAKPSDGKVPEKVLKEIQESGRTPASTTYDGNAISRYDGKADPYALIQLREAEKHNYEILLTRYHDRYTTKRDKETLYKAPDYPKGMPFAGVLRPDAGSATPRPWDVALRTKVVVTRSKVFKLSGEFNSDDGARIDIRISDWDYQPADAGKEVRALEPPDPSQTILIDSISVRKSKFEREMDMSKDPKMYSFSNKSGLYKVVFTFNPRTTSPNLHDRFGWSGEGMINGDPKTIYMIPNTPKNDFSGTKLIEGQGGTGPVWDGVTVPWPQHGQQPRAIRVTYKITREQVQNLKPITDKDIVENDDATPALLK